MTLRSSFALILVLAMSTSACAQAPDARLIAEALSAAPPSFHDMATVYGYNDDGTYRVIREGSSDFYCVGDDPAREGFEASCWQGALNAYLVRGRVLRAEGMTGMETVNAREAEIEAGTLAWFEGSATQYIRYGDEAYYDETAGEVVGSELRYVVYVPYATPESTGLPLEPMTPGGPWLMTPGSFRAHIMVLPVSAP
jgi:hypothetical protein